MLLFCGLRFNLFNVSHNNRSFSSSGSKSLSGSMCCALSGNQGHHNVGYHRSCVDSHALRVAGFALAMPNRAHVAAMHCADWAVRFPLVIASLKFLA